MEAEKRLGDEEENHGDEEGAPGLFDESPLVCFFFKKRVARAVEELMEGGGVDFFRSEFVGGDVDGEESRVEAVDPGEVRGVGGVFGCRAGEGLAGFAFERVVFFGASVGAEVGVEVVAALFDETLDGDEVEGGLFEV